MVLPGQDSSAAYNRHRWLDPKPQGNEVFEYIERNRGVWDYLYLDLYRVANIARQRYEGLGFKRGDRFKFRGFSNGSGYASCVCALSTFCECVGSSSIFFNNLLSLPLRS